MSDDQAAYLDYFVRRGVLWNRPSPLIAEYRRLENEIAIPRRARHHRRGRPGPSAAPAR